jgi:hypothetical protein
VHMAFGAGTASARPPDGGRHDRPSANVPIQAVALVPPKSALPARLNTHIPIPASLSHPSTQHQSSAIVTTAAHVSRRSPRQRSLTRQPYGPRRSDPRCDPHGETGRINDDGHQGRT